MIRKHEIDNVIRGCDNCSLTSTVIKIFCKVKCTFKITLNRTVAIIAEHPSDLIFILTWPDIYFGCLIVLHTPGRRTIRSSLVDCLGTPELLLGSDEPSMEDMGQP